MSDKRWSSRVTGAVLRCVEGGKGGLLVSIMFGADALEGLEHHFPPAVVFALHAREPSGKPPRGKGVAGGRYLCLARRSATEGNMPPIGPEYHPSAFSFYAHRHSPSCVTDASRCVSREPRQ